MFARLSSIHEIPSHRFWLVVLLSGLALRIAAVLLFSNLTLPQLYEYGGIARHLVADRGYSTVFPILHPEYGHIPQVYENATPTAFTLPGFTLIIAGVFSLFGEGPVAYVLLFALNILAGLAAVVVISRCAALLFNENIGRWTAVLAAVYPLIVISTTTFGGTPWYHLAMSLALWLLLRASAPGSTIWITMLAGLMAGAWTQFRAEGFMASLLLALWLGRTRSWSRAALFTGMLVLVCIPWAARNTVVFDKFVPFTTNVWLNAWRGNNIASNGGSFNSQGNANWLNPDIRREIEALPYEDTYELAVMRIYRNHTLAFLKANPMKVGELYVRKFLMFFSIDFSDPRVRSPLYWIPQALLMIGALTGCIVLYRRRLGIYPLVAVIVVNALTVSALHVETRYQLILALLYIVLMAAAIDSVVGPAPTASRSSSFSMKGPAA